MLASPKQPLLTPHILNSPSKIQYCSRTHILKVKPHSQSSWAWKSLLYGRDLIAKHISWTVGNGESIHVYHDDKWIPSCTQPLSHQLTAFTGPAEDFNVSSLLSCPSPMKDNIGTSPGSRISSRTPTFPKSWQSNNQSNPPQTYTLGLTHCLAVTPLSPATGPYMMRSVLVPTFWKLDLPERIKVFIWKCAKGILAVKSGLAISIHHLPTTCPLCENADETMEHLFCKNALFPKQFGIAASSHSRSSLLIPDDFIFRDWIMDRIIGLTIASAE